EEAVGEGLVAVGETARDVDRDRVLVADVLGERLTALAIEDDDANRSLEADEEVVLPALVVVEAADHPAPRAGEVGLPDRLRQLARADELHEPAAAVVAAVEREALDDHLFTPVSSISRPTFARSAQCLPPSCHQPSTRSTASSPRRANSRLTSV